MKSLNEWRGIAEPEEKPTKLFESELIKFREFANMGMQQGQGMSPQQPPQQPSGLAQPAHKADEEGMDLPTMIEKRLEMLMQELEQKSKGSVRKDQQIEIMQQVLATLANKFGMQKSAATQVVQNTFAGGNQSQTPAAQPQVTQ